MAAMLAERWLSVNGLIQEYRQQIHTSEDADTPADTPGDKVAEITQRRR
jgi:hypothetical protein